MILRVHGLALTVIGCWPWLGWLFMLGFISMVSCLIRIASVVYAATHHFCFATIHAPSAFCQLVGAL
jgi:hypothetical protein